MTVKKISKEETWEEEISFHDGSKWQLLPIKISTKEAKEKAQEVIDYFNSTLRPDESPREVVNVFFEDKNDGLRYP